jgi:NitT/TauT family transport system substrate-binding protein
LIDKRPDVVQELVDGIARSGLWLDKGKPEREDAADFVGRFYYNQKPALLRWALTKPMDRVVYTPLAPRKADFDMVRDLMIETGVLTKRSSSKTTPTPVSPTERRARRRGDMKRASGRREMM